VNWVVGHPIAIFSAAAAGRLQELDGIMTAFNLTRIFDDAALGLLLLTQVTTNATTVNLIVDTVAG